MSIVNRLAEEIIKPDKLINFPNCPQIFNYDCGAAALHNIVVFYGGTVREEKIIDKAKTTSRSGTDIEGLRKAVKFYGLKYEDGTMTVEDLKRHVDKDIPVMISIQAYHGKRPKTFKGKPDGSHWVTVIGYAGDTFIFEDPMCPVRTFVDKDDLLDRWIDYNSDPHFYGMAIFGKEHTYDPDRLVPLERSEVEAEGRMEMLKEACMTSRIASRIIIGERLYVSSVDERGPEELEIEFEALKRTEMEKILQDLGHSASDDERLGAKIKAEAIASRTVYGK